VVAGHCDNRRLSASRAELVGKFSKLLKCFIRRVGVVEHVACEDEPVGLMLDASTEQPRQKAFVLIGAGMTEEFVADVPICSVDKAHVVPPCI